MNTNKTIKGLAVALSLSAMCLVGSPSLLAVNLTWTGLGDGTKFSDAANWDTNTVPTSADALYFTGSDGPALTLNNDLGSGISWYYFNSGTTAYTLSSASGTTMIPTGNNTGFYNYGSAPLIINGDVQRSGATLIFNNAGQNTFSNITVTGTVFSNDYTANFMVGGTLTLGGIYNAVTAGETTTFYDVTIASNYGATHPYVTGSPLTTTVIGNITGKNFSNSGAFGQIRLTGSNYLTGNSNFTVADVVLDYVATDGSKISNVSGNGQLNFPNSSHLALVGGTTQESFSYISIGHYAADLGGGSMVIERVSGSTTIKNTGWLDRRSFNPAMVGGLANATLSLSEGGILQLTMNGDGFVSGGVVTNANVNGILRPWVTVGKDGSQGRDWAFKDTDDYVQAYDGYTITGNQNENALITGSMSFVENTTMNSLKLDSAASDNNLDLAGYTLRVKSGGLMYVGTQNYTVSGGTLRMGESWATNDEFIIWQSGLGELTINSDIVARSITKDGTGTLTLGGQFVSRDGDITSGSSGNIALNNGVLRLGADWGDTTAHQVLMLYSGTLDLNGHDLRVQAVGGNRTQGGGLVLTPSRIMNDSAVTGTLFVAPVDDDSTATILAGLIVTAIEGNVHLDISSGKATALGINTYNANTHTGGVTIHDNLAAISTMIIQNAGWFGTGTLHLAGSGGFQLNNADTLGWNNFTTAMRVSGTGNLLVFQNFRPMVFNNTWTGDGELILANVSESDRMDLRNVTFNADLSAFTGTLRLRSGVPGNVNRAWFGATNAVADWSGANIVLEAQPLVSGSGTPVYAPLWLQGMTANQVLKIGTLSDNGNAAVGATGHQFILRSTAVTGTTTFEIGGGNFGGHISNYGGINGNNSAGYSFYDNNPGNYIVALTKVGSGTLTLTNENTYSGSTTVSGGVLLVSGSGSLSRTAGINVSAGGAFVYDSAVALDRNVSVQSGGIFGGSGTISGAFLTLDTGAGLTGGGVLSTGTLILSGALALNDLIYQWDIAADDDYDWLDFSDGLTLTGANIVHVNALNGLDGLSDTSWTILSGQTSGLDLWSLNQEATDMGFTLDFQGTSLLLNYSAIPEPSTWALLVTGVALLTILRRRR
ncbi:MAG: autotransporter-associated beta strand repeat-containing protein [Verrucomicrobiales bacterium]|jgi:autotransporter-associated beta strand protein|nr:autotransporter-associated beta strand repeat-containing protein [Verrucomicrobiales bacterium]